MAKSKAGPVGVYFIYLFFFSWMYSFTSEMEEYSNQDTEFWLWDSAPEYINPPLLFQRLFPYSFLTSRSIDWLLLSWATTCGSKCDQSLLKLSSFFPSMASLSIQMCLASAIGCGVFGLFFQSSFGLLKHSALQMYGIWWWGRLLCRH